MAGGAGWQPAPAWGLETRCSLGRFRGLGRGCGLATRAGLGLRNSLQLGEVQGAWQGVRAGNPRRLGA